MDYKNLFLILIALGNLLLGLWVFCRDSNKKLNQAYLLLSISIIAWTMALVFFRLASTSESALEWASGITDYIWIGPLFTFFMLILIAYGMKRCFLMHSKATATAILKE